MRDTFGVPRVREQDGEKEGNVIGETKGSVGIRRHGQLEENTGRGRAFSGVRPAQAFLASPNPLLEGLDEHTGKGPGFDVGDHGDADILGLGRLVGFLQEVPDIDVSIFSADVEYARPRQ